MNAALSQTVTEFARNPNKALRKIEQGDIILRRTKGKAAIRVTLASRATIEQSGLEMISRTLSEIILELQPTPESLSAGLQRPYPWLRLLPEDGRSQFAREYVETILACASISNFMPLMEVVSAWKSTAEIYADPELRTRLSEAAPGGTRKPVARP